MTSPTDPNGPTGKLCTWIQGMTLDDIPEEHRIRAKYLILDGLACALVGAHLPWSEKAVHAILEMEAPGTASIFGWEKKISPVVAALLNSTFAQGFEIDDWHSEAPVHSNCIVLPALFAASEHLTSLDAKNFVSGKDFLLSTIVGYEVGPRVGLALYGSNMLTLGWHSGAVFGPSTSAAAVSKLLKLPANLIEDALGMACTQAGGLMSAQFESEVKRMQHGFATRNGLFAALMAKHGYVGIKRVYERPYGGFLSQFGLGSGKTPPYLPDEVAKELGQTWQMVGIRVKPYAAMAGTHATVDCVRALQEKHPERMKDPTKVTAVKIELGDAAFHHGGWKAERPVTATGAQMSNAYVAAVQMVDGQVLPPNFRADCLDRDAVWDLVEKTTCVENNELVWWAQKVSITFGDGATLEQLVEKQRGVDPPLSNEEILAKWRMLTHDVIEAKRADEIERMVLDLENCNDIAALGELLSTTTKNPIA